MKAKPEIKHYRAKVLGIKSKELKALKAGKDVVDVKVDPKYSFLFIKEKKDGNNK